MSDFETAVAALIAKIEAGEATEADLDALLEDRTFGIKGQ